MSIYICVYVCLTSNKQQNLLNITLFSRIAFVFILRFLGVDHIAFNYEHWMCCIVLVIMIMIFVHMSVPLHFRASVYDLILDNQINVFSQYKLCMTIHIIPEIYMYIFTDDIWLYNDMTRRCLNVFCFSHVWNQVKEHSHSHSPVCNVFCVMGIYG